MHLCCTKVCYVITNPPLTPKTCPVMNGASTKNAIACAISSGVPSRSIGVYSRSDSRTSGATFAHMSV